MNKREYLDPLVMWVKPDDAQNNGEAVLTDVITMHFLRFDTLLLTGHEDGVCVLWELQSLQRKMLWKVG